MFYISLLFRNVPFGLFLFGLFYRPIFYIKINLLVKNMTEINNGLTCLKNIPLCYYQFLTHFIFFFINIKTLLSSKRLRISLLLNIFSNLFDSVIVSRVGKPLFSTKLNEKSIILLTKMSLLILPSFKNIELLFLNLTWYLRWITNLFPSHNKSLKVKLL